MSFSFSVSAGPRADFADSVRGAQVSGQDMADEKVAAGTTAAKELLIELAEYITRPTIGGSASGHILVEGDGDNYHEGITVTITGYPA